MGTSSVAAAGASAARAVSAAARARDAAAVAAVVAAILAAATPAGAEPDTAAPPGPGGAAHETAPFPAPPAAHPDQAAKAETGYRFAFHPSGDGYLRLDRATGALAVCTPEGNTWTCAAGHDDRATLDSEIARLQRDNAALKNALLDHGVALPEGIAPAPAPSPQADDDAGKSAAEADQAIPRPPQTVPPTPGMVPAPGERKVVDAVTRTWRRLVAIMSDLRRELQ